MAYFKRGWNPQAVYDEAMAGAGGGVIIPAAHNSLAGLDGGNLTERYHLTAAQWQIAIQAATSLLDGYLTNEDWTNFNSKAPGIHALVGANHSASGLTQGHFLRALSATTFGFQELEDFQVDGVQFNLTPTVTDADGMLTWDVDDRTLKLCLDHTNDVHLQLGQELHVRAVNRTGAIIPNGSLVYINGTHGNRPTMALACANAYATCKGVGITTQDIADNAEGYVTRFGIVRGINTFGMADPSILYLSPTTPGAFTTTCPSSPNFVVTLGVTLNSTVNGSIYFRPYQTIAADTALANPGTNELPPTQGAVRAAVGSWPSIGADTHFTSGIVSRTDNTLALSTRTVTISPTGTDFDVYLDAVKFVKTGGASCSTTFGTEIGRHYVYFDAACVLQNSTTAWVIRDGLAPVAIGWWNGSAARLMDERHSAARNVVEHDYLHQTRGTAYDSGLAQTYPTTANDGILQIEAGVIWDEDIRFSISQQRRAVIWYQTAAGVWTWVQGTDNGGYDRPYLWNAGTSRLRYPDTDLAYALTDANNAQYLCVWVYASNDATPGDERPIYLVIPALSAPYATAAQARGEAEPDVKTALSPELKLIYRWVFRGDGEFQSPADDYRLVSSLPGGGTTTVQHNSTLGLQGGTTGEYYHLTAAQQAVVAAYTTVGAALLSLANPGAITFLRVNADNSVSALSAADFRAAINVVNSGDAITMTVTSGTSTPVTTASNGDLLKLRRYGYSASYQAAMLGNTSKSVALGIDPNDVSGGQFNGNNTDILYPRNSFIRVPNSGSTDWETAIKISGGASSASSFIIEITASVVNCNQDLNLSSGKVYKINGVQVLGPQGAAVADATDAASAITQLNALLSRCRALGFIAT